MKASPWMVVPVVAVVWFFSCGGSGSRELSPRDINTGAARSGDAVAVKGLVVTTPVDKYWSSSATQCRYQAWAQDTACTTPPCGIVLKAYGVTLGPNNSAKDCPGPSSSQTVLARLAPGDFVDVQGHVNVETDSSPAGVVPAGTTNEHQVVVDTITFRTSPPQVSPVVISDTGTLGTFVAYSGTGWSAYEGTLVKLQPSGGLTVSQLVPGGFRTTPGNSDFGDAYAGDYQLADGGTYPSQGMTFNSITGVVSVRHGGALLPRAPADFVP